MNHASPDLLARYTAGADLPVDVLWAVEAHLEACAACRAGLAGAVATHGPDVAAVTDRAWHVVASRLSPRAPRRAWRPKLFRWAAPAALPWLAMTVFVPVAALVFDLAARGMDRTGPPVLLLLAPVVPVLGVAASWSRRFDPMGELVCATARSGLALVLRRTLAVLVVVIPVLAVAGALAGAAPALWLLPCLACTAGTLALGARLGVARAAVAVTAAWAALVVAPGLSRPPAALDPARTPLWAAGLLVATAVLVLWRDAYQRLASRY